MYDGNQNFYLLMAVKALAIHRGHAMAGFGDNALADFVRLVGEDYELDILSGTIDKHIQCISIYNQRDIAEHHHSHIMEDRPARSNDQEVGVRAFARRDFHCHAALGLHAQCLVDSH